MEGDSNILRYAVNAPSVISEVIDGETIVLNFESGHYYSFNPSASEIWLSLAAGHPVTATIESVARRFGVEPSAIRADVETFVRSLEAESLIRSSANGASASPPAPGASDGAALGAFAPPAFEKFTDMEELLLLDPIHEVGDTGWPRKPD